MIEEIEVGPLARQAAMLAVLAAGDPSNEKAWRSRVQQHLPMFSALVRDGYNYWGKEAQGIIDAAVFTTTFIGYEYEETSTRLIVHCQSDRAKSNKNPTGDEHMRTERTDIPPGWHMRKKIEALETGQEIVVWKKTEAISQDQKVRVLVHFEPLRSSKKSAPTQGERSRIRSSEVPSGAGGQERSLSESRSPETSALAPSQGDQTLSAEAQAVQLGMADLSNRQKIAIKNLCVGEGIADWADPGPESIDRVLTIIKEVAT
jgi:hypothetical protein